MTPDTITEKRADVTKKLYLVVKRADGNCYGVELEAETPDAKQLSEAQKKDPFK